MFCFLIWKEIFIGRILFFLCCKKCKTNKNFQSFSVDKFYSTFTRMVKEMRDIKLDLNFLLNIIEIYSKKLSWADLSSRFSSLWKVDLGQSAPVFLSVEKTGPPFWLVKTLNCKFLWFLPPDESVCKMK